METYIGDINMKTEIIKVNPNNIDISRVKKAARVIKGGGLVAFPTETVYGLGADALNDKAVAKIFEAKKRPLGDPLIVHISKKEDLFKLAKEISNTAMELIGKFWPGPLTVVLKKSDIVPYIVTAGLDTVAIRMPANQIALTLIKEAQTPISAPSANLFGRPSPTTSQHVLDDLEGKVDLIIDGGKTDIGLESTVLDLTQDVPSVLRPGGVSMEKLQGVIKTIHLFKSQDKIFSPGMYPRHYSPKAKVILIDENDRIEVEKVRKLAYDFILQGYSVGIIAKEENKEKYSEFNVKSLGPGDDLIKCAANLFSILRDFDRFSVDVIISESVKEEELGLAIMDRLRKAAG